MLPKEYFIGWYFKCIGNNQTVAFIPSVHIHGNEKNAFLQIITDDNAFCLNFSGLKLRENPFAVKIGNNIFSEKGVKLDIKTDNLTVQGALKFGKPAPIRYDIMGPFKIVPFMQCRHSVYSMRHDVSGNITLNGRKYTFHNGVGYIEGDRGISFPRRYVWTQCDFPGGALMLSVADIPLFGFEFTGIIGVVLLNGKEYRIATYLGAKLSHISNNEVTVSQGGYELTARLVSKNSQPLAAPLGGKMARTIHESASCAAYYKLSRNGVVLLEFTSDRASFEFEY